MRERYLEVFDEVWVDCLNGDKYKTGKLTPEGEPDPSVFSTELIPKVSESEQRLPCFVHKEKLTGAAPVRFRHLWGKTKRSQLLDTANQDGKSLYQQLKPAVELGFPFMPTRVQSRLSLMAVVTRDFSVSFPGVKTSRDDVESILTASDYSAYQQYFDPAISHEEMRRIAPGVMEDTHGSKDEAYP